MVPKDVRSIIGRSKFTRSTKHKSLKNAQITAAPWVAEWWAQIQQARENPDAALERIAKLMALKKEQEEYQEYVYVEHGTNKDGNPVSHGWTEAEHTIDYYLDGLDQNTKPSEVERMKQLYYGKEGIPLGLFINSWIADNYSTKPHKTVQEARTAVNRVIEHFPTLTDLTVRNRDLWLRTETRSVSSVQKSIGFVRNYYNWLKANQHIGASEVNPFVASEITLNQKLKTKENYLPFEMFELAEIKQAVRDTGDERLLRTVEIAQWTGMRLAEIAQLSSKSIVMVDGVECIRVMDDAKTKAGSRRLIPIAKTLADRVPLKQLPAAPPPVLHKRTKRLVPYAGVDLGKKFGRIKKKLGYGPLHVFHSIRKTATTHFEQAGVPEGITADIVGHKKNTMTYGLYSGGTSVEQRKQAVDEMEQLMLRREAEANVLPFSGDKNK
mgnify:CR=1 FL=1